MFELGDVGPKFRSGKVDNDGGGPDHAYGGWM